MKFHWILLSIFLHWSSANTSLQVFTSGHKLFTVSAYKEVCQGSNSNFVVSPLSAEIILALAQSGAKGATAKEIISGLHLPRSNKKMERTIKTLKKSLNENRQHTLQSANKIYVEKQYKIRKSFKKFAIKAFASEVESIDFSKREVAAKAMNRWVKKKTHNKIQNVVQPDQLDDLTKVVLINTLYFKGRWFEAFDRWATKKERFYKSTKDVVKVDTMNQKTPLKFYESESLNAKFLELAFFGGEATMTFVLPNRKEGLSALEDRLDKILRPIKYTKEEVIVSIPKFRIESEVDFKEIFQKNGIKQAFVQGAADFSGIAGHKGELFIDSVIQKIFVDVNEDGVEAAASTVARLHLLEMPPPNPKEFKADHPFIFYIKVKDLVVFIGRVVDPRI